MDLGMACRGAACSGCGGAEDPRFTMDCRVRVRLVLIEDTATTTTTKDKKKREGPGSHDVYTQYGESGWS